MIARVADRSLREQGAPRDAYVRNGSLGTVAEVREDELVVDFARWGRVAVPLGYLERQVSPGITGGLQHAYALTTHAAQGATFAVSTPLLTDASKPEGVYVGITRGQFDLRAVTIRRRDLYEEANEHVLPTLEGETSALRALELRLESGAPERLASELQRIEPAACAVATRGEKNVEQREKLRFAALRDEEVVEAARLSASKLRTARADIARLRTDIHRREALIEAGRSVRRSSDALERETRSPLSGSVNSPSSSRRSRHALTRLKTSSCGGESTLSPSTNLADRWWRSPTIGTRPRRMHR